MKISIITPSHNNADIIERAIKSVLAQDETLEGPREGYEHIVVDCGSEDETAKILKCYTHLRVQSATGLSPVEAVNKGFSLAEGEITAVLLPEDAYLQGAFAAVLPHFAAGAELVMGRILLHTEQGESVREKFCDPAYVFPAMLRHWEENAFCLSPVGYFFRHAVSQKIPWHTCAGPRPDLAFLLEVSLHYKIKKINALLGIHNCIVNRDKLEGELRPDYWQKDNFPVVTVLAERLPEEKRKKFDLERVRAYQFRRHHAAKEAFARGLGQELLAAGEVFMLPENEIECTASRCGFVEHDRIATKGDWVIPVYISGKVASKSICASLRSLPPEVLPAQVYHVHQMNPHVIARSLPQYVLERAHAAVGLSLKHLLNQESRMLNWKFITGVREPISGALSGVFENWPDVTNDDIMLLMSKVLGYRFSHFFIEHLDTHGINVYDYEFDHEKKYVIIEKGNISILLYRLEELPQNFTAAMEEYLGIEGIELARTNISAEKFYAEKYQKYKDTIRFDREFIEKAYSTQYVKHFYTPEEVNGFMKKWLKKSPVNKIAHNIRTSAKGQSKDGAVGGTINYFLFFVPRSGSTLLTELLEKTTVLGNPQEWLNDNCFHSYKKSYGYNPHDLDGYMRALLQEQRTSNGVFGMELAHHQLNQFEDGSDIWKYLNKNDKYIFLRREKILEQAISLYKSKTTNIWHTRQGGKSIPAVEYDQLGIRKALKSIIREELNLVKLFSENALQPMIITYEEIVASNQAIIEKIAGFLGVDLPPDYRLPPVALKKIGNREEVENLSQRFINETAPFITEQMLRLKEAYLQWQREKGVPWLIELDDYKVIVRKVGHD